MGTVWRMGIGLAACAVVADLGWAVFAPLAEKSRGERGGPISGAVPQPIPSQPRSLPEPQPILTEPSLFLPAPSASAGKGGGNQLFAPQAVYPLDQWQIYQTPSGVLTQIQVVLAGEPENPKSLADQQLTADHSLFLQGWAGEPKTGQPFAQVVFSLCERVIGAAPVATPSLAIAQSQHPNLTTAQWSARLPVAFLPRCANPVLQAWAVGPGQSLSPLQGQQALRLSQDDARLILPTNGISFAPVLRPANSPSLVRRIIRITSTGANLRRCGDLSCPVTGVLPHGDFPAQIFESRHGWTLIKTESDPANPQKAGWISDGTYTALTTEQARAVPLPILPVRP